jgi:hypothetical protein
MLELGAELFAQLNARQQVGARQPVVYGSGGLPAADIRRIEGELGFRLPDDFAFLLQNIRDPGQILFPYATFNRRDYDAAIAWVRKGIEFDIEENGFWNERWGRQPEWQMRALEVFRDHFATWPKLLPLHAHRFLVAEPCQANNPVFSIMGTDIICYGANLAHYLMLEFVDRSPDSYGRHTSDWEIRSIDVWSELAS